MKFEEYNIKFNFNTDVEKIYVICTSNKYIVILHMSIIYIFNIKEGSKICDSKECKKLSLLSGTLEKKDGTFNTPLCTFTRENIFVFTSQRLDHLNVYDFDTLKVTEIKLENVKYKKYVTVEDKNNKIQSFRNIVKNIKLYKTSDNEVIFLYAHPTKIITKTPELFSEENNEINKNADNMQKIIYKKSDIKNELDEYIDVNNDIYEYDCSFLYIKKISIQNGKILNMRRTKFKRLYEPDETKMPNNELVIENNMYHRIYNNKMLLDKEINHKIYYEDDEKNIDCRYRHYKTPNYIYIPIGLSKTYNEKYDMHDFTKGNPLDKKHVYVKVKRYNIKTCNIKTIIYKTYCHCSQSLEYGCCLGCCDKIDIYLFNKLGDKLYHIVKNNVYNPKGELICDYYDKNQIIITAKKNHIVYRINDYYNETDKIYIKLLGKTIDDKDITPTDNFVYHTQINDKYLLGYQQSTPKKYHIINLNTLKKYEMKKVKCDNNLYYNRDYIDGTYVQKYKLFSYDNQYFTLCIS